MLIFFTIYFKYFDRHFAFINILFNFKNTIRSKRQFITFFIRMKKKPDYAGIVYSLQECSLQICACFCLTE